MGRRRKKNEPVRDSVGSAVSTAFSNASELKDELQSWFDNLHENFQNGSKGEALQSAMDQLDATSEPDIPALVADAEVEYFEVTGRKVSRRDRLDACVNMLQAAADHAREEANALGELEYDDDGNLKPDQSYEHDAPATEEERDDLVTELESFADECETAIAEWESVEFPGMYG